MSAPNKELLKSIEGEKPTLKHVEEPKESLSTTQAKVLIGVQGKKSLHHIDAPNTGLTEAQKAAFINKEKDE
jgi:hypothetical protein